LVLAKIGGPVQLVIRY